MDRSAQMDSNTINSRNFEENESYRPFVPILRAVLNQQFKIGFLKECLGEVEAFGVWPKCTKKMEFAIMKDLIRLGLEKYILHLMNQIKDELAGNVLAYRVLDAAKMR